MAWAMAHNGDTLTITAWQALGLLSDIEARKSKVLVIGLCRTQSTVPRMYYTLKDVCTVAVSELKPIFSTRTPTHSPYRILKDEEKKSREDGHIGAMMVICMELLEDDERDLLTALGQISTANYQPLRVFEVTRTMVARLGQLQESQWKACLANVLRGGLYFPTFRTS
ncbi:hypothetical protein FB45DRAFT_1113493 [Roridomyces roridus]|uniref:Uncharacterized protein n=1 Tax=Roridomyces roridus TaxID=1738132 RepID=A0AAD7FU67_9AGAR|nr:hypothetical protein FB45DRAFT_1113493 [Roridomyces roridus]